MKGEDFLKRDGLLEAFAAELTVAAYRVALRTRTRGAWVDLELGLWSALAEKVKRWDQDMVSVPLIGDTARVASISPFDAPRFLPGEN